MFFRSRMNLLPAVQLSGVCGVCQMEYSGSLLHLAVIRGAAPRHPGGECRISVVDSFEYSAAFPSHLGLGKIPSRRFLRPEYYQT